MTLLSDAELSDFWGAIAGKKLEREQFELEEGPIQGPGHNEPVGPLTGTVKVTFTPSGVSRTYSTGHGSSWVYLFDQDLHRGVFTNG